jgi:replicative DNA helicase
MSELPNNPEAERAALCVVLTHPAKVAEVAHWLRPDMFYSDARGDIWKSMLALFHRGDTIGVRSLSLAMKQAGAGMPDIAGLMDDYANPDELETYVTEIERTALLRQLIAAGAVITKAGYQEADADKALGSAQKALATIALHRPCDGLISSSEAADREYARLEAANAGDMPGSGVRTGERDIDEMLYGLNDSDLIVLAARPSVGKTAFLLSMAHGIARTTPDRDVLIFSLEMSEEQLRYRRISMLSRLDSMRVRSLRLSDADQDAYMSALGKMAEMAIYVDATPAVPVSYLRSVAYRHQARYGRPLVLFVDYLQLMTAAGEKLDNRVQAVSEISRGLKALAKELRCPVVALSQLSRAVESRTSKVPLLSDLRESGSIEQDADVVMFIYREELYDKDTDKKGIAEIHIAKHRNGPIGVVPMRFDAATTSFETLTYRTPEGY